MKKINILFFIESLSGGGAEKVLCNLVNAMDPETFNITVQTIYPDDSGKYLNKNIHYYSILKSKNSFVNTGLFLFFRLCAQLSIGYSLFAKKGNDIEVAYLETISTKVIGQSTNKPAKKIAWVHCNMIQQGLVSKKIKKQYNRFDHVICVSQDVKNSFDLAFDNCVPSSVLYNVNDENDIIEKASESVPIEKEKNIFKLLTVGRLSFEKGCDRLLKVSKRLVDGGYSIQTYFVGEGDQKSALMELASKLGIYDCVFFNGFQTNPYPWMKHADMIVIPSRTEGLSTVAIESIILGKAVVTTDCAGMQEIFGDSEYGLIVDNNEDGLYQGIKQLIDDPLKLKNLEYKASIRSKKFRMSETLKETEVFFKELLQERR